jgi:hypothetical protein
MWATVEDRPGNSNWPGSARSKEAHEICPLASRCDRPKHFSKLSQGRMQSDPYPLIPRRSNWEAPMGAVVRVPRPLLRKNPSAHVSRNCEITRRCYVLSAATLYAKLDIFRSRRSVSRSLFLVIEFRSSSNRISIFHISKKEMRCVYYLFL